MAYSYSSTIIQQLNGIVESPIIECDQLNCSNINASDITLNNKFNVSLPMTGPYTVYTLDLAYQRIGNIVTLYFPITVHPADASGVISFNLPSILHPTASTKQPFIIVNTAPTVTYIMGSIQVNESGTVNIYAGLNNESFTIDNYAGFYQQCITYLI